MKKRILSFVSLFAVFAFFAININSAVEAQSDPAGLCPDGKLRCAVSNDGTKTWHKGNSNPQVIQ